MAVYILDIAKVSGRPGLYSPTQDMEGMKPCFLNLCFCSDFFVVLPEKKYTWELAEMQILSSAEKGGELGHMVSLTLWTVCCIVLGPPHIA